MQIILEGIAILFYSGPYYLINLETPEIAF